ncbi:P-loop containing nucleoside triphosphate hydrolase protein, partial [Panaeolus papilionaceus]
MATTATGSGKTGFYAFLMLVIKCLVSNPDLSLKGSDTFPKNPVMLVVLPTKALQYDMQAGMQKFGLEVVVVNSDEVLSRRKQKGDLWSECVERFDVILISPEELVSLNFNQLLANSIFFSRVCRFGVDEAHLINTWGKTFRTAFKQLGFMRVRLPSRNQKFTPLITTSATIREGQPKDNICKVLGLREGSYHLIRRSNLRHDIQLLFRPMAAGPAGQTFPELAWVLDSSEKTVIFTKHIATGFRVGAYLWKVGLTKKMHDLPKRIRLFNSLNWVSYNQETLGFLNDNPYSTITIATDILSVGWDSPDTKTAIIFGEPNDVDDFVQKVGRVGRDRSKVSNPRAILYYTKNAIATANELCHGAQASATTSPDDEDNTMDISMARLLLAPCYMAELNRQYNNPTQEEPCLCSRC